MTETTKQPTRTRRDMIVAASCGVFVAAMVGMAYASVPLYDWFCRTTGFGGKPQVATVGARKARSGARSRCASTPMSPADCRGASSRNRIPSRCASARSSPSITSRPISRRARRSARRPTMSRRARPEPTSRRSTASASPSSGWVPARSARCRWCSTSIRRLPRIAELDDLNTITLSYSFYALREPVKPVAERATKSATN